MGKKKSLIFFAYQGGGEKNADENIDAIKTAIRKYNKSLKLTD